MVTGAEAARIKGVSRQAVYSAIEAGRLKAIRVGPIFLVNPADLEEWTIVGHRPKRQRKAAEG